MAQSPEHRFTFPPDGMASAFDGSLDKEPGTPMEKYNRSVSRMSRLRDLHIPVGGGQQDSGTHAFDDAQKMKQNIQDRVILHYLYTALALKKEHTVAGQLFHTQKVGDATLLHADKAERRPRGAIGRSGKMVSIDIDRPRLDGLAERYPTEADADLRTVPQDVHVAYEICRILDEASLEPAASSDESPIRRWQPAKGNPFAAMAAKEESRDEVESVEPTGADTLTGDVIVEHPSGSDTEASTADTPVAEPAMREPIKAVTHAAQRRSRHHGPAEGSGLRRVDLADLGSEFFGTAPVASSVPVTAAVPKAHEKGIHASLVARLDRAYVDVERARYTKDQEIKEKARIAKRDAIKEALRMSPAERERNGIYLVGVGELDEHGNIAPRYRFSQYTVYAVFPYGDEQRMLDVDRATLAEVTRGVLANPGELAAIDKYMTQGNIRIWPEEVYNIYNRHVGEIAGISKMKSAAAKKIDQEYTAEQLDEMKLAWLAATLPMARELRIVDELQNLWSARFDKAKNGYILTFNGIIDENIPKVLSPKKGQKAEKI